MSQPGGAKEASRVSPAPEPGAAAEPIPTAAGAGRYLGRGARRALLVAGAALLLVLPLVVRDRYLQHVLVLSGIATMLAVSFNLLCGYAGLLNLGHAAFFGVGAYSSAIVSMRLGLSPWLTLPVGGLAAAVCGVMLGIPSFRLRGPYLAIVTISFSEIIRMVATNWVELTRGSLGLYDIPPLTAIRVGGVAIEFVSERSAYYVVVLFGVAAYLLVRRLLRSDFGISLESMREDESGAEAIGIDTMQYKLTVFVLSAFLAGFAGALHAHYVRLISPEMLGLGETMTVLTMALVGGLGTLAGPVVGAVVVTFLSEALRALKDLLDVDIRLVLYGAILMATVLFMRKGIVGLVTPLLARRGSSGGKP
jgi:branched-chain amino acid transport system permease protein